MLRTRIPPPVYAVLTGAMMWLIDRHSAQLRFEGTPWAAAGWCLTTMGIAVDLIAIVVFIRRRTTINPMRPDRASRLVVSGIFGISRNPMYLGLVCSLVGWGLLLRNPMSLLMVWIFVRGLVAVQITPEETALRGRFGNAYIDYSNQVNRWLGRKRRRK